MGSSISSRRRSRFGHHHQGHDDGLFTNIGAIDMGTGQCDTSWPRYCCGERLMPSVDNARVWRRRYLYIAARQRDPGASTTLRHVAVVKTWSLTAAHESTGNCRLAAQMKSPIRDLNLTAKLHARPVYWQENHPWADLGKADATFTNDITQADCESCYLPTSPPPCMAGKVATVDADPETHISGAVADAAAIQVRSSIRPRGQSPD